MLKPHVWVFKQGWAGDFILHDENEWKIWEYSYEKYIIYYAYYALYQIFWNEPWFAGGFIWKWYDNHTKAGGASIAFQ